MNPRLDDSSAHSEVSGGRSSSSRSKSKRTQLLHQHKSQSTSAIDTSSSSRKSKSKSKSNRRQSIDNSTSSGSRSSSSRRLKEKSSQQQQTKELLVKQQHRRGSLDSCINDYRKSTTSHQRVGTNDRMDRGVILEKLDGGISPTLRQSTNSTTSRFSTNPYYRRPSQDLPTPTRSNNTINTNNNKAPSVVVHACDDKGRCIFHPHIQLRKKSIMGLMGGWKDILHVCPDCEKQELQELLLREKEEITKLELMLGRLDQHDVEYLNDDGVDDDGNYLPFSSAAGPANSSVGREEHLGGQKVVQITFGEGCRLPVMKRRSSV